MAGRYGAREAVWNRFHGGLCTDVDPAELAAEQCSDCLNVDFDGQSVRKRKGRTVYNAVALAAAAVRAVYAYYTPGSGLRKLLAACGTVVKADTDGDGAFDLDVATGLTSDQFTDLIQYKDRLYLGNGADALRKWLGSGASAAISLITAPAAAPRLTPVTTPIEAFDDHTAWTLTGTDVTKSAAPEDVSDDGAVRLECTSKSAQGTTLVKTLSSTDLSGIQYLSLWIRVHKRNPTIRLAFKDDSGTLNWAAGDIITRRIRRNVWTQVRVEIAGLAPADRETVTGIGFRIEGFGANPDGISVSDPVYIDLDHLQGQGPHEAGLWRYWATYYNSETGQESNPSAAGELRIEPGNPVRSVTVTVDSTTQTGIDLIRIYRHRDDGQFSRPRLVGTVANSVLDADGTDYTFTDEVGEDELGLEDREVLRDGFIVPPVAKSYALVNHRLFAGNIVSPEVAPYRVYISRLGNPEEFSSDDQTFALEPGPIEAGWLDLPERDPIVRIVEVDGMAVVFCSRSVWTVEGGGFDEYRVSKRAAVGLDAREAVLVHDRLVYFLAADGLRVLAPTAGADRPFPTWVLSEPVGSLVRAAANRHLAALGLDEQGRIWLSYDKTGAGYNTHSLVFDPRVRGALSPGWDLLRPGWTLYDTGYACFHALKRGGGDDGELLGGGVSDGKVRVLNQGEADEGSAIAWHWQSGALEAGSGQEYAAVRLFLTAKQGSASQAVTAAVVRNGGAATDSGTITLSAETAGPVSGERRLGAGTRGQQLQAKFSGSHSVAFEVRSCGLGYHGRMVR